MNQREYLDRIHFIGNAEPVFEVLCRLQTLHLLSVPFENLDIHYGIKIQLDVERIFQKVVRGNRGGFCYELNGLFYELLTSIGFKAKRISARTFSPEKGYGQEYDHFAIVVMLNETEYLADVGFGEFSFAPLSLNTKNLQPDERGDFAIDRYDEEYIRVSKIENGDVKPQYIFKNIGREFSEYEAMCNYHQTSPDSHFTRKKMISLPTENGRITLTSDKLKIKEGDCIEERLIHGDAEFEEKLWQLFKIRMPQKMSLSKEGD